MNELAKHRGGALADYDPDKGLKTIAVAEAAEKHWARAKNTDKLFEAIEAKLQAQLEFVQWWDAQEKYRGRPEKPVTADRLLKVADLGLGDADAAYSLLKRWRRLMDRERYVEILADAHRRAMRICELQNANTIRGTEGTGEFERYTPAAYVEAARAVLGEIDLDPASCREAQGVVRAKTFFSIEDDGLAREWRGRVFLNPPYHRELAPLFIDKLLAELTAGHTSAAILLTNNSTDTAWFQKAARSSAALCFPAGRINFWTPNGGDDVLPTQGQAFTYFGADLATFVKVFDPIGFVTP